MKLCIVYGTRPEYLKLKTLIDSLKCKVIRILQHNTIVEEDLIYDYSVEIQTVSTNRLDSIGSQILSQLSKHIHNFTHIIVQGDTATTFYTALCAFQNNVKVIHLEAGLRTYDTSQPYPEEAYRQMISRITSVHLCPHKINAEYLHQEKVQGNIYVVGNTILDLVNSYNLKVKKGNIVLITYHRRENLQYLDLFIQQLKHCMQENTDKQFVWFLHPNKELQEKILSYNLNCLFLNPCNHRDFLDYMKNCFCLITDSGGIQEESAFLGKPTIVLRHQTERDQLKDPYIFIVGPPFKNLCNVFSNEIPSTDLEPCYVYGNGKSTDKIIQILNEEQYA